MNFLLLAIPILALGVIYAAKALRESGAEYAMTLYRLTEDGKAISKEQVRYRPAEFPTASCGNCRYFVQGYCQVLDTNVDANYICDAWQGKSGEPSYAVAPEDMVAFGQGMVKLQPYQHKVVAMLDTPVGWLVLIEDTMRPPHRFSLPFSFHVEHTSREHYWTQEEVDWLIKEGQNKEVG